MPPLQFIERHANNARIARWGLVLQPFRFLVRHRPGRQNQNADSLSRVWWCTQKFSFHFLSLGVPNYTYVFFLDFFVSYFFFHLFRYCHAAASALLLIGFGTLFICFAVADYHQPKEKRGSVIEWVLPLVCSHLSCCCHGSSHFLL